jgi:hypothetical protein
MNVKAHPETGVFEKTVDELCGRTTWPPGLVLTTAISRDRIAIRAGVINLLRLIGKSHVGGGQNFPLRS